MTELIIFSLAVSVGISQVFVYVRSAKTPTLLARITLTEIRSKSDHSWMYRGLVDNFRVNSGRNQRALYELPEFLDLLVVALASGEGVFSSIRRVTQVAQGILAKEFEQLVRAVQLGQPMEDELIGLAQRLPQQQVVEFCNKLNLANRRGTPLAHVLQMQSITVRTDIQNQLFKQAGKNETRMMIPLVFLILPITVLFAIYPSLQLLNISTI
jgi:tight adherence protein C